MHAIKMEAVEKAQVASRTTSTLQAPDMRLAKSLARGICHR